MKTYIVMLLCAIAIGLSAQNLVPNGDFELYDSLPNNISNISDCKYWLNPGNATPDYLNKLSYLDSLYPLFLPISGFYPHSGNGAAGIVNNTFDDRTSLDQFNNYKEYIYTKLKRQIGKGDSLEVSFWVYQDTNSKYSCNGLGVSLSTKPLMQTNYDNIRYSPQFKIVDMPSLPGRGWQKYSFIYVAEFAINFITIGNFNPLYKTECMTLPDVTIFEPVDYVLLDDISVKVIEKFRLKGDTVVCEGNSLMLNAYGCERCHWFERSNLYDTLGLDRNQEVTPRTNTTYLVKNDSLSLSDSISIKVLPRPKSDLIEDQSICHGDSVSFHIYSPHLSVQWQDGDTSTSYSTKKAGTYVVTLVKDGCTSQDTLQVHRKAGCEFGIEVPNIFTPNKDGKNDVWMPLEIHGIASMTSQIYDRWGTLVFSGGDKAEIWDGKGGDEGIYYWEIQYSDYDDIVYHKKGILELRR